MLHQQGGPDIQSAVQAFERGWALAREQEALAWELRVAASMVRTLAADEQFEAARDNCGKASWAALAVRNLW
jgi:hypothetical protein